MYTRDHAAAIDFYRGVFHWETNVVADSDDFRYTTMADPSGGDALAGIMDAKTSLPADAPAHWSIYWEVHDAGAATERVKSLGGSILAAAEDTPHGRIATVTDPTGAQFRLRQATP